MTSSASSNVAMPSSEAVAPSHSPALPWGHSEDTDGISDAKAERQEHDSEICDPFRITLAPDFLTTANVSGGGPYDVEVPFLGPTPSSETPRCARPPSTCATRSCDGSHNIRVMQDGYEPAETVTDVKLGEPKNVTLTLSKEAPITAKWWFWTTIGAVVVGGAVLTVALLTEKDAPRGDIAPGQVRF